MRYYFAPLEGITDMVYRKTHRRYYPGLDRYYTPFISPTQNHRFTPKELRELSPENNAGVPLVPQLLGKNAEDFLWAAGELAAIGYEEVNLNLGCPSGTVTAKGKGAGFLKDTDGLDRFLEAVFTAAPLRISVKTRIGMRSPEEFAALLRIYDRYPICELIIHPRTGAEMYDGGVHYESFAYAAENTSLPLCFNGNLFTAADIRAIQTRFPRTEAVMLGRGLTADPGLVCRMNGLPADRETLRQFHGELCRLYPEVFGGTSSAMHRMKAVWSFMLSAFDGGERFRKPLIKARTWADFLALTETIFQTLELTAEL